jgi:hypothetical protein
LIKARLGDLSTLALLGNEVRETLKLGAGPENCHVYHYSMTYYDAACVHAVLAKLAIEDQKPPASERQRIGQQDLERALELFGQGTSVGRIQGDDQP